MNNNELENNISFDRYFQRVYHWMDKAFEAPNRKLTSKSFHSFIILLQFVEHYDEKTLWKQNKKTKELNKKFFWVDKGTFTRCTCRSTEVKTDCFRTTYNTFMFRPPGSMLWMIDDCWCLWYHCLLNRILFFFFFFFFSKFNYYSK